MSEIALTPPLGPVAWLFPELLSLQREDQDAAVLAEIERTARALGADPELVVRVPAGPRGHAVAAALRPLATAPWQQVPRAERHPHPSSLEGVILAAQRRHPDQAVELRAHAGIIVATSAALEPGRARTRGRARSSSAWVLPIRADATGVPLLEAALASVACEPESFAAAGLVPVILPAREAATNDAASTQAALSWWGLFAGADPPPGFVERHRALVALLYPERVLELDGYASLALSGCDLYSAALRAALALDRPASRRARAAVVGVCGIDGSGKSTHVRALADHLTARGANVAVHKIYRHGVFHATVTDLVRRTVGGRNLHLWRMERLAKAFDSVKCYFSQVAADLASRDVVVFDRYVHTHFAAGAGRCHWDPFTRELLSVFPPADSMFLLDVPVEVALARIGERRERTLDENSYMLGRYREMLRRMARDEMTVLDGGAPFATNHARICAAVDTMLAARGAR